MAKGLKLVRAAFGVFQKPKKNDKTTNNGFPEDSPVESHSDGKELSPAKETGGSHSEILVAVDHLSKLREIIRLR